MLNRLSSGLAPDRAGGPQAVRPSALRASALQRLAFVAAPVAALWIFVAFALDAFA
jgi:hypothetical protein